MVNTAIETVVDLYTDKYHPKAKIAKDVGAGAVLLMAINSVIVAYFIFLNNGKISELNESIFQSVVNSPKHLIFVALILIVVATLIFYAVGSSYRKKVPTKKFFPSGQAAVAFAILTAIWMNSSNVLIFVLAAMLSVLVFVNRIENKMHSLAETVFGSFMGVLIMLLICGLTLI
jgi:diacylglycerol kinase (ATP)